MAERRVRQTITDDDGVSTMLRHHRLSSDRRIRLSTIGDRAFPVATSRLWNTAVVVGDMCYRRRLRTRLFIAANPLYQK